MADQKAKFVPGFQGKEPASLNEFIYVEADSQLHRGDECYVDQYGVAHPLPVEYQAGVYKAPLLAYEDIPKGQFGWCLRTGSEAAYKEAIIARATAKASQIIDTKTKVINKDVKKIKTKGEK